MKYSENISPLFDQLTDDEQDARILEMYSRGESYEVIQENLFVEYGMEYSKKKLGHKMGEIKRKMKCETQFQMGYIYRGLEESMNKKNNIVKKEKEPLDLDQSSEDVNSLDHNRGINEGLVMASIFWLIIYALVSHYIQCP